MSPASCTPSLGPSDAPTPPTPPTSPTITVGGLLVAIAVVHQLVGVTIGAGLVPGPFASPADAPLTRMWRAGVLDSVGEDPWNGLVTWFLLWGFLLALLGAVLHSLERTGARLPTSFAWGMLATCILGVTLMPASGFWLGAAPIALAFTRSRR